VVLLDHWAYGKTERVFIQLEKIVLLTSKKVEERGSRKGTSNGPQKTTAIPRVSCPGRREENWWVRQSCFFGSEGSYLILL
jgi:hypothetical protein